MLALIRKLFRRTAKPERAVAPHKLGFTLEYWRGREDLVKQTQEMYRTRWFQEWVSVLHHELPLDSTIEAVRAHKRLLRIMEHMATHLEQPPDELPTTFGAEREFPELNSPTNEPST